MDIGNLWNSLYTSQMLGTQMYGLQSDPLNLYGSYADAWQASPWQYSLQTGSLYGNTMLQTWQNAGFVDTLNDALTKYSEGRQNIDAAGANMEVSTHEGSVLQLGYDKALVYLPEEQKMMVVQTAGNTESANSAKSMENTKTTRVSGAENMEEKGILVDQRKARASNAYRRTQRAGQRSSLWAKNNLT